MNIAQVRFKIFEVFSNKKMGTRTNKRVNVRVQSHAGIPSECTFGSTLATLREQQKLHRR